MKHVDEVIVYEDTNRNGCAVRLRLYEGDRFLVALVTDLSDQHGGMSLTNSVEIAMARAQSRLADLVDSDPRRFGRMQVAYVEHYPHRGHGVRRAEETFDLVRFSGFDAERDLFENPSWKRLSDVDLNDMLGELWNGENRDAQPRVVSEGVEASRVRRISGDPGYDPDCPACLRGRPHTDSAHERALERARSS